VLGPGQLEDPRKRLELLGGETMVVNMSWCICVELSSEMARLA